MERIINNDRAFNTLGDCPWPESLLKTATCREDEGSVGMRNKKVLQTVNVNWSNNLER
jgi:hypothetical protein